MLDELENRKRRRLYLAQSDCRVRVLNVDGDTPDRKVQGHLYDISQSGMRFGVNHPLKEEAILETEILLSREPIKTMKLTGKLVREHHGACLPDEDVWEDSMEGELIHSCLGRKDPHIYAISFDFSKDMQASADLSRFLQQQFLPELGKDTKKAKTQ